MIVVQNKQRSVKVDTAAIRKSLETLLDHLGYHDFDMSVVMVNNKTMQQFNAQFRNKDKPTNILAFPFHHNIKAGTKITAAFEEEKNLGDLILAPLVIQEEATDNNQSFERRVQILLVHGLCHLLGYDHVTDTDYKKMNKLEKKLISLFD